MTTKYYFQESIWVDGIYGEAGDSGLTFTQYDLCNVEEDGVDVPFNVNGGASTLEDCYVQVLMDYCEIPHAGEDLIWDLVAGMDNSLVVLQNILKDYDIEVIILGDNDD